MKKNKSFIFITLIFIYEFIMLLLKNKISNLIIYNTLFFFVISIILFFFIGTLKYKKKTKYEAIQDILILDIIFIIINTIIGLFSGFNLNNLSLINLFLNIITLLSIEISRYSLIKNCDSKYHYLIPFLFILSNIYLIDFNVINLIELTLTSILLTFISYNVGVVPSIIHVFLINIFKLFVIVPNSRFVSLLTIIVTIILFIILYNLFKEKNDLKKVKHNIIIVFVILIILPYIALILGIGDYKLIGIVSDSMKPEFKRGDAVIYKKIDSSYYDFLKVGDILVYKKDEDYIVHRIIKKDNNLLITKGDNNKEKDNDPVTTMQYIGIVKMDIPIIGYINVWLSK